MPQCPGPQEDHRQGWRGRAAAARASLHPWLPPPSASAQYTPVPSLPGETTSHVKTPPSPQELSQEVWRALHSIPVNSNSRNCVWFSSVCLAQA